MKHSTSAELIGMICLLLLVGRKAPEKDSLNCIQMFNWAEGGGPTCIDLEGSGEQ